MFSKPVCHSEENAVNLVYGLIGLHNTYELGGFEEKRQAALNALVACCPRKAAPYVNIDCDVEPCTDLRVAFEVLS